MPLRRCTRSFLPALLLLAQAHAAPASTLDRLSGRVTVHEHIALPQDATLTVELLDVSAADAQPGRLARLTLPVGKRQLPLAFELPYYPSDVNVAHRYAVRAMLSNGGELLLSSLQPAPVLTHGAGQPVMIELQRVQLAPSDAALENTYWKLIEVDGRLAQALPGEREAHIVLFGGSASGNSGCNKLMGRYALSPGSLRIGPLASTRMACPPAMMAQEAALVAAFARASSYRVAGETLTLLDGDQVLASFTARHFK